MGAAEIGPVDVLFNLGGAGAAVLGAASRGGLMEEKGGGARAAVFLARRGQKVARTTIGLATLRSSDSASIDNLEIKVFDETLQRPHTT